MTDELKPCLAYPCDGHMKENNYDASLECSSCQFIVADESEYNALVAGKQAAIDAALMKMRQEIETLYAKGNYTSVFDFYEDCLDLVSLWEGDNPLVEAQTRIAELEEKSAYLEGNRNFWKSNCAERDILITDLQQKNLELARHNMELRDRMSELERELSTKDDTIVDGLMKRKELHDACRQKQEVIDSLMAERNGLLRMGEHQAKHLAKVIQERDEARTFIGLNITWLEDYYDAAKSNMSAKHSTEFLRWINACRKIDAAMRQEGE